MPRNSNQPAPELFAEIEFVPFNQEQIEQFVIGFIKIQQLDPEDKWSKPETYLEKINSISGLKELIKTPFLLKMFVTILPSLNKD